MSRKKTKDDFIKKAVIVHNGKYSYDKFVYVRAIDKGIITCPIHGDFEQSPNVHLRGVGCPKCALENRKGKRFKLTLEDFIENSSKKHNNKYSYELVGALEMGQMSDVEIICPIHGKFVQKAVRHLHGCGCPKCANEERHKKNSLNINDFVESAREIHSNKYDYSKVEYVNNKTKVCIVCPTHGEFWQRPDMHLKGDGCPKCDGKKRTIEDFTNEAVKIHGDKYDYSESVYESSEKKIKIKCKKCGRSFFQKPWVHLQGHGCPYCNESRGESEIDLLLKQNSIEFERNVRLPFLNGLSVDFLINGKLAVEVQGAQHFIGSRCFGHKELGDTFQERDKRKKKLCDDNGITLIYYTQLKNYPTEYLGFITNNSNELLEKIKNSL